MNHEKTNRIIGYILLLPAIVSVIEFTALAIFRRKGSLMAILDQYTIWTGTYDFKGGGGAGYTSALPIYLGLMAIAGAYLIANNKN